MILITALLALPLAVIVASVFWPDKSTWSHLADTVLADYVINSALLAIGVGVGTFFLGTGAAWLLSVCEFPGRRVFEWALLLPLAMPAYIIAYTYTGLLDVAGPVQSGLRALTGWSVGEYPFPEVRSLGGAIVMLTLVLYPYVYMLSRAAFLEQSASALNVARSLGLNPWQMFRRVALPLARPSIVAGLSLAIMETLADYGTVQYFGIPTLTTGIFRTWFGLDDTIAAAQLSALLLTFIFTVIIIERLSRRQARYHHHGHWQARPSFRLRRGAAALAFVACALPLALGFLVPSLQLLAWSIEVTPRSDLGDFAVLVGRSLGLAGLTAILALLLALFLAYGHRLMPGRLTSSLSRIAGMGYALPGTVIAVGVIIPFAAFDNTLDAFLRERFGVSSGLLLSGTLAALVFAYLVRFLAVSLNTVEAGLGRIRPSMDEAAQSMGSSAGRTLWRVHIPLIRGSLLTAALLVFVDVLKELPATLVLRPFDFNTLAVRAFELASDERLRDAALPALAIVAAGLIPVILVSRSITRARGHEGTAASREAVDE
ncbi:MULTISPECIES: iron ABC transporter permease [unclassified Guyparkeria]|uniref:ABC transporter permease n=1 Tax=unclassified Guyparkeria TaxID=2626246 RepID=UPI000AFE2F8D|nr:MULTISPECIES: iron ABC transporter permease [unclassified Guyparkeria]